MTLYYAQGPEVVARFRDMGFEVFLDLKLHDIPHQVEGAAREIARLGVGMFTVHASGGAAMMEAAVRGACDGSEECGLDTPSVLAVTVLTSMDDAALGSVGVNAAAAAQVDRLGALARDAGVQGVVCSPHESAAMRELLGPGAFGRDSRRTSPVGGCGRSGSDCDSSASIGGGGIAPRDWQTHNCGSRCLRLRSIASSRKAKDMTRMTDVDVFEALKDASAILSGHFVLTSGRHSDTYVQCARILEDPALTTRLAEELAARIGGRRVDLVAAPAVGGIIIGFAVAQALGVKFIFSERESGKMQFRRSFQIPAKAHVLVVEDVVTTGGSVAEVASLVREARR